MTMLYINGRFLTQPLTGVQRFALEISRALQDVRDDIVFLVPRGELTLDPPTDARMEVVGRNAGHTWEQLDLPRYLARIGSPLLLGLASTGPAWYRNQVVTHHDITYVRHPESFSPRLRALYRLIVPPLLRNSRAIVTVSEFSRREIAGHYGVDPEKITVVSNAVDASFSPPTEALAAAPTASEYFLAVSSPNAHKNFMRLIEAYRGFDQAPHIGLKIVGSQARAFRASGIATAAPEGVEFLGVVADDELVRLYQGARAFVIPSLYEGFGIPPLEAQACGSPVIAADIPSLRETLGDSAHWVAPASVSSIRAGLDALASDEDHRRWLITRGDANTARYSWQTSAEAVNRLVRGLVVA